MFKLFGFNFFGSRKRPAGRGAAAVEFAIVAPVFFLMLYGIIDFGRMLMVQEIIVNAAREGARAAITPGETDAQVSTIVSNYLAAANITGGTSSLSPTEASGPATGTAMTSTVSVPCASVSWVSTSPLVPGDCTCPSSV